MRAEERRWRQWSGVAAVVAVLATGCPQKRPPAVVTGGTGKEPARATTGADDRLEGREPESFGPEIQAVPGDATSRDDLAISAMGDEAGPLADIYFDFDQATLTDAAKATLVKHAAWLAAHPQVSATVEGHCDERGTVEYNLALGDKRARAVRDHLAALGVAGARLRTVSFGKERPLDTGHDENAWTRNRRAHFAVTR